MTQPILELKGVKKSFGSNDVLRGVDIDVAPGRSLVVLGGSGSGKSRMTASSLRSASAIFSRPFGALASGSQTIEVTARALLILSLRAVTVSFSA